MASKAIQVHTWQSRLAVRNAVRRRMPANYHPGLSKDGVRRGVPEASGFLLPIIVSGSRCRPYRRSGCSNVSCPEHVLAYVMCDSESHGFSHFASHRSQDLIPYGSSIRETRRLKRVKSIRESKRSLLFRQLGTPHCYRDLPLAKPNVREFADATRLPWKSSARMG